MGGAAAVLALRGREGRALAFVAVLGLLAAYDATAGSLWDASLWWDVAWVGLVLIPATFALVWLALPLAEVRGLLLLAPTVVLVAFAAATTAADLEVVSNLAKLAAAAAVGFWLLNFFETLGPIVLVAGIIPWVDAWSVWRGPTHAIVTERREIFTTLSVAFPSPGGGSANLGLPDVLFFALFLATAVRFRLRPGWTWAVMTASFGLTMVLANAFEVDGLPALPALAIAFLGVNGDLIWRRFRPPKPTPSLPK